MKSEKLTDRFPLNIFGPVLVVAAILPSIGFPQPALLVDSLYSQSLGRTMPISVFVPDRYDAKQRYPVLYLLHGFGGNHTNWSQRTQLANYLKNVPLIVVMPDGENSWYVNSPFKRQDRFEDYLASDIFQYVQKNYSIDTAQQAIAGLSMGGYGAMMIALRHPCRFRFVGSLSGALTFTRELNDTTRPIGRMIAASLRKMTNVATLDVSAFRREHDLFELFASHKRDTAQYYYFSMGVQDWFSEFIPIHRALTDSLREWRILYEYHESPGGHTWKFWDREIEPMLQRIRTVMNF
jgi:S-formylglutathione hydrolase FrmB